MLIECYTGPMFGANAYLVADEAAGEAIIVDAPGGVSSRIGRTVARDGLRVLYLVDTHNHADHVAGNHEVRAATGAAIAVHKSDARYVEDPDSAPLQFLPVEPTRVDRLLDEGDEIRVGSLTFRVLHTPGHTPGSICLHESARKLLLSGDTLFAGSYGRYDLPEGDRAVLYKSLRRLAQLPPDTRVYPGHGPETTIGDENWLESLDEV